jgi:hypothetical protein
MAGFFVKSLAAGLRGAYSVKDVGFDGADLFGAHEIGVLAFNTLAFCG